MKQRLKWDDYIGIFLLFASVFLLGVSVFLSFSRDIWYDELFSLGLAVQPLGELVSITARDVHPPLYYMIVKLFLSLFGTAGSAEYVVIAKLTSVLPFFLCIVYAATKVRKHFGLSCAGLFAFLVLTMPKLADYTVEVRMYGYALFFITAGMLHAYELACREDTGGTGKKAYGNWAALTLYAVGACYTHYFACVAACMIYLYLLSVLIKEKRWRELKAFFISGLCCVVCYLPWLGAAVAMQVGQVKENYWIQPLSWRTIPGCIKFIFQPSFAGEKTNMALAVLLFLFYGALPVLAGNGRDVKSPEKSRQAFFSQGCMNVLAGIILFGMLASVLLRPVFVYRYMLPGLGVFWLAFAIMTDRLRERKFIFLPVVCVLFVIGARNYRAFYGEEMWKRVQMEAAEVALAQMGKEDIILYNFDQTQAVLSYYLDNDSYLWYGKPEKLIQEMFPANHALVEGEFSDETGIEALKNLLAQDKPVWFFGSGNARDEIMEKWSRAGIRAQEKGSVMVERYWFNIYSLCADSNNENIG